MSKLWNVLLRRRLKTHRSVLCSFLVYWTTSWDISSLLLTHHKVEGLGCALYNGFNFWHPCLDQVEPFRTELAGDLPIKGAEGLPVDKRLELLIDVLPWMTGSGGDSNLFSMKMASPNFWFALEWRWFRTMFLIDGFSEAGFLIDHSPQPLPPHLYFIIMG